MNANTVPPITVRREIAAPAQELFDAWLDPKSLSTWMHPGSTVRSTAKIDPRVGGTFEILMYQDSGKPIPHTGTYKEIDRPRRLVFTWNSPAAGQNDSLVTIEFRPVRGVTEIVLTHEKLPSKEEAAGHNEGWTDILRSIEGSYARQRSTA